MQVIWEPASQHYRELKVDGINNLHPPHAGYFENNLHPPMQVI